jgi:Flp pilus assembly pilin Flp
MLKLYVVLQVWWHELAGDERGQTTAEYALVLLGAAAVALVLVAWAAKSGKVADLLDGVIDKIMSRL